MGHLFLPRLKIVIKGPIGPDKVTVFLDGKDFCRYVPLHTYSGTNQEPMFRQAKPGDVISFEVFALDAEGRHIVDLERERLKRDIITARVV